MSTNYAPGTGDPAISFTGTNTQTLRMDTNIIAGYTKALCVRCTTAQTSKDLKISFIQVKHPCKDTLTNSVTGGGNTASPDKTLAYQASPTTQDVFTAWSNAFANSGTSACNPTSCVLKNADCTSSYTAGNLLIGNAAASFKVSATTNIAAGWTETFCV